jgi:hypothetical protein
MLSLQEKDASKPAGNWFQLLMVVFFLVALRPNAGYGLLIHEVS